MRSHLFALSSTSGVGLKETPSVRCYGDCAPAKESERERERKQATCLTSRNGKKGFSKVVGLGMRPNRPKSQLSLLIFHLLMVFKNLKNYDPIYVGPSYHCFLKEGVVQSHCWTNIEKSAHHLTIVNTQSTVRYTYMYISRYTYLASRQIEKADMLKKENVFIAILKALRRKYYF